MLNRKQILKIRELSTEGFSVGQIAKELKISYKTVDSHLESEEFSTHPQNLNALEPASIPNIDDDSGLPRDPSKVLLAPSLQKKLSALGMTSADIVGATAISPRLYYLKLNDVERTALKIFLERYDAAAVQELEEIKSEIRTVAKQELNRLDGDSESGEIGFEEWDKRSEELILEMEVFSSMLTD